MFSKLLHTFENFILKFLPFYFYPKKSKVFTLSKFRAGLKCDSLLWYYYNHNKIYKTKEYKQNPYRNPQFDQLIFYAQSLFKDAISIQTTYPEKSAKITSDMLTHKKPIFNAGVLYNDLFSKNGILVPSANKDKWDIIEIKHTNTVKKDSFMELAYQVYVAELCGLKIQKCYVLLINSDYYCNNSMDIEPSKFFIKQDITESVRTSIPFMKTKLEHFKKVIHAQNPLKKSLNHSCKTPKSCTINSFCWGELQEGNIFELRESNYLPQVLLQSDIKYITDIPDNVELSPKQKIQISCSKTQKPYFHIQNLKKTFSRLKYPYYFLDFETINPPIPVFNHSKPFQHIPFLFSLHIEREINGNIEHYEYINDGETEPREKILLLLKELIQANGSIICYNDVFEKKCIREATQLFPEYQDWFNSIVNNFFDLSIPFRNFDYYHPGQRGSASLKSVFPVLTELNYNHLNINNGLAANQEFLKMKLSKLSKQEKEKIKTNLLEYCKLDTYAMVMIVQKLKDLVDLHK